MRKIIAIDFDGTMTADGHADHLVLKPDCAKVIKELYDLGFELILWTCREEASLKEARNFLASQGLLDYFSKINTNSDLIGYPTRKIIANVYIDDRNIDGFTSWKDVLTKIKHKFGLSDVSRKQIVASMCMTQRHDCGLRITKEERDGCPWICGMTDEEYIGFYNGMAQVFDNDIAPVFKKHGIAIGE